MAGGTRYILSTVLLLSLAVASKADVLILRNGDRIEGDIVKETPVEISIRRAFRGGKIRYVKKIKRAEIARIEKTDDEKAPAASEPADTKAKRETSLSSGLSDNEGQRLLANTVDKIKQKNYEVAGAYLTRLINNSTHRQLIELSAKIERKYALTLADLAAETHMRAAVKKCKGRTFRLQFVTEFEKPSLVPRLIEAYKNALSQKTLAESKRSTQKPPRNAVQAKNAASPVQATRPAESTTVGNNKPSADKKSTSGSGRGYAIASYLDQPKTFDGDKDDARELSGRIRYALGLLAERMRYDPQAKQDRTLRTVLLGNKKRLQELNRSVLARAEGALTPQEKEEQKAELLRQQEEYRQQIERKQMRHERYLQQTIRAAQDIEQHGQPILPPE